MKKVLTICTVLVALCCLVVYAGNGITVVDRGNVETKAAAVTKAEVEKAKDVKEIAAPAVGNEQSLPDLGELEARILEGKHLGLNVTDLVDEYDKVSAMSRPQLFNLDQGGEDCANAIAFNTVPYSDSGTEGATDDCAGRPYNDVFYVFTVPADGDYQFDMCNTVSDSRMTIRDATCCTGTLLADGDDECGGLDPKVTVSLTSGQVVYIECGRYSSTTSPTAYNFHVEEVVPVECTPHHVMVDDDFLEDTDGTCGDGNNYADTGCLGSYDNGEENIIKWTVETAGWYVVSLATTTTYTGIAIATDCEATDCIRYKTNYSSGGNTFDCFYYEAGTYYFFIDTYPSPNCIASYTITTTVCEAPEIGRCCYGSEFAPQCEEEYEADCLARPDDLSWVELETCQSLPCVAVEAGRCCYGSDPLQPLCLIESEASCLGRYNAISWTAGINDCELYPCEPITCEEPAGAVADECVNAIPVGALPAHFVGITTSTMSAAPSTPSCGYMAGPAVWYSVVGTGNTLTAATCDLCTDPTFDTVIRVYACDCASLICVGSADGGCAYTPGSHSSFSWCSEAGEVYLIAVGGYFASDYGYFILDVTDDGVACTGAIVCPESGACCYNDGADCADVTEAECDALSGDYYPGVLCSEMECPIPCPFDNLDVEPGNNTCDDPPQVYCNNSYCGARAGYDSDYYKLVITDPDCQELTISIWGDDTEGHWPYGGGMDTRVDFYGPDDCTTLIAGNDDNYGTLPLPVGTDSYLELDCLQPGTYWIKVGGYSLGTYVMQLDCTPCTCPSQLDCHDFVLCGTPVETEPNGDCATANPLVCGDTMYGVICEFDEHDFYEIAVPAMSAVFISLYDGEGCTTYPTECVVNDLLAADCATVYGTGNTAGWTLTNSGAVGGFVYLDVYGTSDMCVSTYMVTIECCDIVDGCSGSGQIYVEVIDGYYSYLGNTCCNTNEVMTIADECTGYPYGSGPDAIFEMDLLEDSYIDRILLTMTGDCQFMIFTDCADPEGSCVAAADALVGATEELLALSLPAGQYYLSVSLYSSLGTACGPFLLEIWSDFPLPVELVNFDAIAGDRSVTLNWATASETNNDRFDVFANGELRGTVDAKNLAIGGEYSFTDAGLTNGTTYDYSVKSVSLNGEVEELFTISATPSFAAATITEYALHQNFPNPFNPETKITFDMVDAGFVNLTVYNLLGQQVATLVNGTMDAGRHIVSFEANSLPSGLYLYRMETDGFSAQKKMILMK